MAAKAIETLTDVAHELDVCQSAAVTVLDGLTVSTRRRAGRPTLRTRATRAMRICPACGS
ncbi:MAG: hypothetical protein ACLTKG_02000 [Collinsella intestinalis]